MPKLRERMTREGMAIARDTVARLLKRQDLRGAVRGKRMRTAIAEAQRPNQRRVSDFPHVTTRPGGHFGAVVINAIASDDWPASRFPDAPGLRTRHICISANSTPTGRGQDTDPSFARRPHRSGFATGFATANAGPKRAWRLRVAAAARAVTTRRLARPTACTRRNQCLGVPMRKRANRPTSRRSRRSPEAPLINGRNRGAMSRPPQPRPTTPGNAELPLTCSHSLSRPKPHPLPVRFGVRPARSRPRRNRACDARATHITSRRRRPARVDASAQASTRAFRQGRRAARTVAPARIG